MTLDPAAMTRLLEITGGDQGFVDELIDTFIEDATAQIDGLRSAASAGDAEAIIRPAHSLKSNAANVGATALEDLARDLEGAPTNPGPYTSRREVKIGHGSISLTTLRPG